MRYIILTRSGAPDDYVFQLTMYHSLLVLLIRSRNGGYVP